MGKTIVPTIVLVGAETSGNVGAVARAMKNFGCKDLLLVSPVCDHLDDDSIARASHAADILKKAKTAKNFAHLKKGFDVIIGTTAKSGSDYNIPRLHLSPMQLSERMAQLDPKTKVALVFGRESSGLSNEELLLCDFTVYIPASNEYPTLNLSHAVAVVLYELSRSVGKDSQEKKFTPMSDREKEVVLSIVDEVLDSMTFTTPFKRDTQKKLWKRMIGKAMLTKREAYALIGFLRNFKIQMKR